MSRLSLIPFIAAVTFSLAAAAQGKPTPEVKPEQTEPGVTEPKPKETPKTPAYEGTMTLQQMGVIIKRLDTKAQEPRKGYWRFAIEKTPVVIITDAKHDRMRILVPIGKAEALSTTQLTRMMQANFDTALDSRYAIAKGVLWATFIHPLRALHDRQFISAIGQTVNIALTFGTTYTSGQLSFQGGDSSDILRRQLIDKLLKKGQPI
ncbi:MAG: type III secretion system chaperone [Methyloligellaceae bacterium]